MRVKRLTPQHNTMQPRSQGLSSSYPPPPPHRASEERPWHTLVTCHFDNWKLQGGVLCNQAIGRVGLRRMQSIALCCDRYCPQWLILLSLQAEISNSIYSNVYLKVKQVCLEANYLDHLTLLPSYPLYLWKVSHTALIVGSPLNALNQIDAKTYQSSKKNV